MEKDFQEVKNKNHTVYYRFIDQGSKETVVFIHGLLSTSAIFRYFSKILDKNIILIELRGVVYSKIKSPFLDGYAEDIKLVMEKEKIKTATLVGYSLGCTIANHFGEKWPEMVDKIIMLAPVNKTLKEIGRRKFVGTMREELGKGFFKRWRTYLDKERKTPWWWIFGRMGLFNIKLLNETYTQVQFTKRCKVIIVNGKKDTFFNFQDQQLESPNIIHQKIENLDHFLFLQKARIQLIGECLKMHLNTVPENVKI